MNKFKKILLSILGGIDTVFYMFTPIIVSVLWVSLNGINGGSSYFFYSLGLFSTLFRAIKIGWLK